MKVSNKQVLAMFEVLKGSLNIADRKDINFFGISYEQRYDLVQQILNQQSDELIELKLDN